jgi:putative hydrolase
MPPVADPDPGDLPDPFGEGPFGGLPMFGDLARMLGGQGPVNWEVARQMARWLATNGATEANVDPMVRVRFEELYRIAEMHVIEATGLLTPGVTTRAVTRSEWAAGTLDAWKPLLEKLSTSLAPAPSDEALAGTEQMMAGLAQTLSPMLLGMQAGSMVGHLSRQSLGTYDLPVPRSEPGLVVVPANVDAFAEEWSLPVDDARLYIAVTELTHHAVFSVDHVRQRFESLVGEYVAGFRPDPSSLEDRIGDIDPTDMDALRSALGDPEALLGAMSTPEQQQVASRLSAAVAALLGYVDRVTAQISERVVGNAALLAEAQRRRRVAKGQGVRFVERLFGVELNRAQLDRGHRFVSGVAERDADALGRLWRLESGIPTPSEIEAPGLWVERTSYEA